MPQTAASVGSKRKENADMQRKWLWKTKIQRGVNAMF